MVFQKGYISWNKGKKLPPRSEETKEKLRIANLGKKLSEDHKKKISNALKGKKQPPRSEETKLKISNSLKGKKRPLFSEEWKRNIGNAGRGKNIGNNFALGNKHSEETREKMRIGSFEYVKKTTGISFPRIGKNEKQLLDEIEQKKRYRIIRQYKVGGYYLDGYIPEINLAIEVDEKYHENKKEKDIQREEFIKAKLGCEFLRIKD